MTDAAERIDRGQTMAEMWDGFATTVIPDCPPGSVQHDEMKNAFYAGGLCLFNWFMVQMDEGQEPTDADLARVDAMDAEIHHWFAKVAGPPQ
jgi:hypothetical protein